MRTLKAVSVEQVFALFVTLHTTLGASDALSGNSPEKTFTFVAIGGTGCGPRLKVVRRSARYWVDKCLKCLLVHVRFLQTEPLPQCQHILNWAPHCATIPLPLTSSSSFKEARGRAEVSPALRLFAAIVLNKMT